MRESSTYIGRTVGLCPLLTILLVSFPAVSQPPLQLDPEYVITNWRAEEGLPESSATDMVQTPDGYLWLGTFSGLVRFDGARFTVFSPANVPALTHAGVVRLHIDRQKWMWVGTLGGIARYRAGNWEKVAMPAGWRGFTAEFIESAKGLLCIKSSRRDIACGENGKLRSMPGLDLGVTRSSQVRLLFDSGGQLHAGVDSGVLRLRNEKWEPAQLPAGAPEMKPAARILWGDAGGGHWVAQQGDTLFQLTKDRTVSKRRLSRFYAEVLRFLKEGDGTVWLVSDVDGLIRVAPEGRERQFSKATGLDSSSYRFLFVDRDGNHWAGSNGAGLFLFRKRTVTSAGVEMGLPDVPVKSVGIDSAGDLLVGTYGAGLQRQRGNAFRRMEGPGPDYAQAVLCDRSKRIWVGSYQQSLWLDSGHGLTRLPVESSGGLTIEALFEDRRGRVWIGASERGTVFENGEFRPVEVVEGKRPTMLNCFAEDTRSGAIWAGGDGGLYRFENDRFVPVKARDGQALPSTRAISVSENGALWLGTAGSGLYRWQNGELTKIPLPAGFNGVIAAILRRGEDFWISTSRGIWRIDKTDLEATADHGGTNGAWRHFSREDGMVSFEAPAGHQPAAVLGPEGKLLFATLKGVAIVDPARNPNAGAAAVLFENISFRNEEGNEESMEISREQPVTIPSSGQDVQVSFTSVSGGTSANLLFDYELWHGRDLIASGRLPQSQLRLHRLMAGENTLRLRATNAEGAWSPIWTDLNIYREPYVWERWQTQLGAVLVVIVATGWGFRRALRTRAQEHEEKVGRMRELQESLLRAKEAALESARVKGEFLANMSHEIRTPLNGILGAGKLLEMTGTNGEQRDLIGTMMESGEMLRRLLSDILELSQIEAGRMVLQPTDFNFRATIAEAVRLVEPEAKRKGLRLGYEVAAEVPEFIRSDATRIQQIALNYLNNAVKFTELGSVDLNVIVSHRDDSRLLLQIRVSDTGAGIASAKHEIIFNAFEQADSSSTRRKGGIGLGLSIVKRIAELLGGTVGLESYEGVGSTFWATFRAEVAEEPRPAVKPANESSRFTAQYADLRILLAEDNRVNQLIATRMLNRLGCSHVDVAENGKKAIEKAADASYDLILMDIHMPEMDGIQATRELRLGRSSNREIPIVALTASVLDVDRERCREAGMNDFLPKPLDLNELRRIIESLALTRHD